MFNIFKVFLCVQGHAVSQLCKTLDNITLFGTASKGKEETIKDNVTHLFDHSVDYVQEVRKYVLHIFPTLVLLYYSFLYYK